MKRVLNPAFKYSEQQIQWLDGEAPEAPLEVYEERARTIISENKSPDVGFRFSVNPYRGCFHGCSYCYARPTHQYLDFGAGTDFERRLVVKINAATLLESELNRPSWKGDSIMFSGITDCYQPIEAQYALTRKCLKVCLRYQNPVGIITKGALIRRDIELLSALNQRARVSIFVSLAFADDQLSKLFEPGAPRPSTRLRVIEELSAAGIPVGIGVAPIIPGLNDEQIPLILERAFAAGARRAFHSLVRLPSEVAEVFRHQLESELPARAQKILNSLRRMRDGKLNNTEFGARMHGRGVEWEAIRWLFSNTARRLGYEHTMAQDEPVSVGPHSNENVRSTFCRPNSQLSLPGMNNDGD